MTTEERILQAVTAGNLRQRVTLMQSAMARDDYGNSKKAYSPGDTVWAYIENHSSQVYETAGEVHIVRKSLIAIRYREGIHRKPGIKTAIGFMYRQGHRLTPAGVIGLYTWNVWKN